jgi:hypothetical protein
LITKGIVLAGGSVVDLRCSSASFGRNLTVRLDAGRPLPPQVEPRLSDKDRRGQLLADAETFP